MNTTKVVYEIIECSSNSSVKLIRSTYRSKDDIADTRTFLGVYFTLKECKHSALLDFKDNFNANCSIIFKCKKYKDLAYHIRDLEEEEINEQIRKNTKTAKVY